MRRNLKLIVLTSFGLLGATALLALSVALWNDLGVSPPNQSQGQEYSRATLVSKGQAQGEVPLARTMEAAPAKTDPVRRNELLEQWAESVDVNNMANTLEQNKSSDPKLYEVRHALLSSWSKRDLAGAVAWFGQRGGADGLHEQARDLLGQALAGREPAAMVSWMETSLPESSRKELYGPFFREWTSHDPASAAAKLREFAIPSQGKPNSSSLAWDNLLGQVAAQWANADVNLAVNWVQSLPEGAAKSRALAQVSHRWAGTDPQAAAAYATTRPNDSQLLKNVAGTWAESDPQRAAIWARELPADAARSAALAEVAAVWSQKDPEQAAAFAASLPPGSVQNQAVVEVASVWASMEPTKAAQWVGQFPENPIREQALQGLMTTWAENNSTEAAQWLQGLPNTHSRDFAINAFSGAVMQTKSRCCLQVGGNYFRRNHTQPAVAKCGMPLVAKRPVHCTRKDYSIQPASESQEAASEQHVSVRPA